MTAIVAGQGLGLQNTSAGLLGGQGQVGSATQGRAADNVYVNASNGNLVVQQQDEWLVGTGPDAFVLRTYNSQGAGGDDNADNWQLGLSRRVQGLSGSINQTSSYVYRLGEDGSLSRYDYSDKLGLYVSEDGSGSFDTLSYASGTGWSWKDGDTQVVETYAITSGYDAKLSTIKDVDNNQITLTYSTTNPALITKISTSMAGGGVQEYITINYESGTGKTNNISSMTTTAVSAADNQPHTSSRVSYTYDASNRLSTVVVDLTPDDPAQSASYTTTYGYDGSSKRLASINQSDGSKLEFEYTGTKIWKIKETVGTQVLTTRLEYNDAAGITQVYDALGGITELQYVTAAGESQGQLSKILRPAVNGVRQTTQFTYDGQGNVATVVDARGYTTAYGYDKQGNRIYERDGQGNVIERVYSGTNLLLQETTYKTADPDEGGAQLATGPQTTRYVYDAKGHVRFQISPQGRVTQYTYNSLGQMTRADQYTDATFDASTLTTWSQDFSVNGNGLGTPLPTQFTVSGGALRVSTVNQGTQEWPNTTAGGAQPLGSSWRMEITTTGTISEGLLDIGIDSGSYGQSAYRRHRVTIYNGHFYAEVYVGQTAQPWVDLGAVQSNKTYVVEIMTTPDGGSTLYIYESGKERSSGTSDSRKLDGWGTPTLNIQNYSGPATTNATILVDNISISQPTEALLSAWAANCDLTRSIRTSYEYNTRGQLKTSTQYTAIAANGTASGGQGTTYVYDQAGNLLKRVNPATNATIYTYDGLNRVTSSKDGNGVLTSYEFQDSNRTTSQTLSNGLKTLRVYDKAGRLISEQSLSTTSSADYGTTQYAYDDLGRLVMVTSAAGNKTVYLYDAAGRKVGEIDATGALTSYTYNAADQVVKTTQWANKVSASVLSALQANPNAGLGNYPAADATNDRITLNVYDKAGRLVKTIDAGRAVVQYDYDGSDRLVRTTHYLNLLSTTQWNNALNATSELLSDNANLQPVSSLDRVDRNFYDADGKLEGTLDSGNYYTAYTYDAAGQLTKSIRYARSLRLPYLGGGAQPLVYSEAPANSSVPYILASPDDDQVHRYYYNTMGQKVGEIDALGYYSAYSYKTNGQLNTERHYVNAVQGVISDTTRPTIITSSQTPPASPTPYVVSNSALDNTISYAIYDNEGRLKIKQDSLGRLTGYIYDDQGNLLEQLKPVDSESWESYVTRYDQLGRVTGTLSAEGQSQLDLWIQSGSSSPTLEQKTAEIWAKYGTQYVYDKDGNKILTIEPDGAGGSGNKTVYYYDADGRVAYSINALGEVRTYSYNTFSELIAQTDVGKRLDSTAVANLMGGKDTAIASAITTLIGQAGSSSSTQQWAYDTRGNRTKSIDALLNENTYFYNSYGELSRSVVRVDSTRTLTTNYQYDFRGNLQRADEQGRVPIIDTYDAFGRLVEHFDQASETSTYYKYDRLGRQVEVIDGIGASTKTSYDVFGRVLSATDQLGHVTTYVYNPAARSQTVTTAEGIATTTVYNDQGLAVQVTDGRGNVTVHTYDHDHNLTSTTVTDSTTGAQVSHTETHYDSAGRAWESIDANGVVTRTTYDETNRVLSRTVDYGTGGLNLTTRYRYDALSQVNWTQDAEGVWTRIDHDAKGQVKAVEVDPVRGPDWAGGTAPDDNPDGLGLRTEYTYDAQGHVLTVIEGANDLASAKTTQYVYDIWGRREQEIVDPGTDHLNLTTSYTYDEADNVVARTDAGGHVTRYVYDAANRQIMSLDATGAVVYTVYDAAGHVSMRGAFAKRVELGAYGTQPALDMRITVDEVLARWQPEESSLTQIMRYVYDKDGRQIYSVDPRGYATKRTYDAMGNVVSETAYSSPVTAGMVATNWVGGSTYSLTEPVIAQTTEQQAKNITTQTVYDAAGRAIWVIDGQGYATANTYDAAGHVIQSTRYKNALQYVTAGSTLGVNQVPKVGVSTQAGAVYVVSDAEDRTTRTVYDKAGRVSFVVDAQGYVTGYTYNKLGQQESVTRYANALQGTFQAGVAPQVIASTATAPTTGSYVRASATTDAVRDATSTTQYDPAGRVFITENAEGTKTCTLYDSAGRLWVRYDAYGSSAETITLYGYDSAGHLTEVTQAFGKEEQTTTRFIVDALGQRTGIIDPRGVELTQQDTTWAVNRRKELGYPQDTVDLSPAQISALLELYTTHQEFDANGHVTKVTDPLGHQTTTEYDAFGNAVKVTKPLDGNPLGAVTYTFYDLSNHAVWQVDALGYGTNTTYDAFGQVTDVKRLYNKTASLSSVNTQLTLTTLASLFTLDATKDSLTQTQYDKLGRKLKVTDAENHYQEWSYGAFGEALTFRNMEGAGVFTYTYDRMGRKLTEKSPVQVAQLDASGNVVFNGQGQQAMVDVVTHYTYDARGNVTSKVEGENLTAQQRTTTYKYDRLDRQVEESGSQTSVYDGKGNTTTATPTKTTIYDRRGNVIETNVNGARTLTYWDALNRQVMKVTPTGTLTIWEHDALGNVTLQQIYPKSVALPATGQAPELDGLLTEEDVKKIRTVAYTYDELGRVVNSMVPTIQTGEIDADTGSYEWRTIDVTNTRVYDANGNVVQEIDGRGNSTWRYYDKVGNLTATIDAERYLTTYTYDGSGHKLTEVRYATQTPNSVYVRQDVPIADLVTLIGAGGKRTVEYTYDRLGQLKTKKVVGVETATVNASSGVLTTGVTADAITEYSYNALGLVIERKEATGEILNWSFDQQGRQIGTQGAQITDMDNPTGPKVRLTTATEYNALGLALRDIEKGKTATADRITSYVYDANGVMTSKKDAVGNVTTYRHDASGNVTSEAVDRYDAEALNAQTDANAKGKLWIERQATTTDQEQWVNLNGRTSVPAATGITFSAEVTMGSVSDGRAFIVGMTNAPYGGAYASSTAVGSSYRHLEAYFQNEKIVASYRDASGAQKDVELLSSGAVAGKKYLVTVELQGSAAVLKIWDITTNANPATPLASQTVNYGTGKNAATEWGSVRAHVGAYEQFGGTTWPRDSVDNFKIFNAATPASLLMSEDFSSISTEFEYVNNQAKAVWQVDANGRSGRISTDYTDYAYDAENRQVKLAKYSTYAGNADASGALIHYAQSSQETEYNAFGEISKKGENGYYHEEIEYNNLGQVAYSNSGGDGVYRWYYYDANGNLTLKLSPSNNHVNDDLLDKNKTSGEFYVYDKRNLKTDTFTKRVDDLKLNANGIWVPDGGAITQGVLTGSGTSISNVGPKIGGTHQWAGTIKLVTEYSSQIAFQAPSLPAYENGDLKFTLTYNVKDKGLITKVVTCRPGENVPTLAFLFESSEPFWDDEPPKPAVPIFAFYSDNGSAYTLYSLEINVQVSTKAGYVNLGTTSMSGPSYPPTLWLNSFDIKNQPANTAKVVFMYRDPNDPLGEWKYKSTEQLTNVSGKAVEGWFRMTNWDGIAPGKYDVRYVALDSAGNVLNAQDGEFTRSSTGGITATQYANENPPSSGHAYLDGTGLAINELGSQANTASVWVRTKPSGSWQSLPAGCVTKPSIADGAAINGWFQINTSSLPSNTDYEFKITTYTDVGQEIDTLVGQLGKNSAGKLVTSKLSRELTKYSDLPQVIKLANQPVAAVRAEVFYKVAGTQGLGTAVNMVKQAPGKFSWDAVNMSLALSSPTDYALTFRTYDAAGQLLSESTGSITLGPGASAELKTTDNGLASNSFILRPPISAAYAAGSYMRLYIREDPSASFQAYPGNILAQDGQFSTSFNLGQLQMPATGFREFQYYYEIYNVNNQKITTVDMWGAASSSVPTQGTPGNARVYSQNKAPAVRYDGWFDPNQASHQRQVFNAYGEIVQQIDALQNVTDLSYNALGKLILKTDPTTEVWNESGVKLTGSDARPKTYYYYDLQGRLIGTRDANGFDTTYVLAELGDGKSVTVKEFHPDGGGKTNAYDIFGDLRKMTNEIGGVYDYTYDAMHRLTRVDNPVRETGTYATKRGYDEYVYDSAGNRIKHTTTTDGLDALVDYTYYDNQGRVVKTLSADKRATATSYVDGVWVGAMGYEINTTQEGIVQLYAPGIRKTVTNANGKSITDEMDVFGHVTQHTDLGGHRFTYVYDKAGGLMLQTSYDGTVGNGNNQTWATGQKIYYTYYDDGRLKSIQDLALNTYTLYGYDVRGNKTFEGYASIDGANFYQKAVIEYDELNRIQKITDPQYAIEYRYDAVGNRRYVKASGTATNQTTEYWYAYDSMNRFTTTMGVLGTDGKVTRGTSGEGVTIGYDYAGNRTQAIYARDGHTEKYTYTKDGYLGTTQSQDSSSTAWKNVSERTSDLIGRVKQYKEYDNTGALTGTHDYLYYNDNQLKKETVGTDVTTYTLLADGTVSQVVKTGTDAYDITYQYAWWDSAQVKDITATSSNTSYRPGTSAFDYDANGHVSAAYDMGGQANRTQAVRTLRYTNNAQGLVLFRDETAQGGNESIRQTYFYIDGQRVGEVGNDTTGNKSKIDYTAVMALNGTGGSRPDYKTVRSVTNGDFDQNYQAINDSYPGFTSSGYTVRSNSEKLENIARAVWGDSSLWYLIAEANGMSSKTDLKAGQVLKIPNKVTNIHNNSQTSSVYNPGSVMGNVSPSITPVPPAPPTRYNRLGRAMAHAVSAIVSPVPAVNAAQSSALADSLQAEEERRRIAQLQTLDAQDSSDASSQREQAQSYDYGLSSFGSYGGYGGYSSFDYGYGSSFSSLSSFSDYSSYNYSSYLGGYDYDYSSSLLSGASFNSYSGYDLGSSYYNSGLYGGSYLSNSYSYNSYSYGFDSWGGSSLYNLSSYSYGGSLTSSYYDSYSYNSYSSSYGSLYDSYSSSYSSWSSPSYSSFSYDSYNYGGYGNYGGTAYSGSLLSGSSFSSLSSSLSNWNSGYDSLWVGSSQDNSWSPTSSLPSLYDPSVYSISNYSANNYGFDSFNKLPSLTDWSVSSLPSWSIGGSTDLWSVPSLDTSGWMTAPNSVYEGSISTSLWGSNPWSSMDMSSIVPSAMDNMLADIGLGNTGISYRDSITYREDEIDPMAVAKAALMVASFIPGVGVVAGLASAAIDAYEGNYGMAALSLASMVPGMGALKVAERGVAAVGGRAAQVLDEVASISGRVVGEAGGQMTREALSYGSYLSTWGGTASSPLLLGASSSAGRIAGMTGTLSQEAIRARVLGNLGESAAARASSKFGDYAKIEKGVANSASELGAASRGGSLLDPYAGVKDASAYLKSMGVSRAQRKQILESFEIPTLSVETAGDNLYGLRFHDFGKTARPEGQYLFETFTPQTNRAGLALPPEWNGMTGVKQWQITPGTTVIRGRAGPQFEYGAQYGGGAEQMFVLEPWKYGSLK